MNKTLFQSADCFLDDIVGWTYVNNEIIKYVASRVTMTTGPALATYGLLTNNGYAVISGATMTFVGSLFEIDLLMPSDRRNKEIKRMYNKL